jgi:hypothetical protein
MSTPSRPKSLTNEAMVSALKLPKFGNVAPPTEIITLVPGLFWWSAAMAAFSVGPSYGTPTPVPPRLRLPAT